jgi:hypothetical protein
MRWRAARDVLGGRNRAISAENKIKVVGFALCARTRQEFQADRRDAVSLTRSSGLI